MVLKTHFVVLAKKQEVDASSVRKLETAFLVMVANWIGMEILLTPRTSQFLKYYALNQSKT